MRKLFLTLALVAFGIPAAIAQQSRTATEPFDIAPRYDLEIGYNFIHARALAGCDCFNFNGGFVSGGVRFTHRLNWLGAAGEVTGQRAGSGYGITLMTFMGGPRITYSKNRYAPYGEILFGGARASDSYFPTKSGGSTTGASSWAYSTGGGLDINLTPRIGIRAVDVQYLRTHLPNGADNTQGQLQIGSGIQFRLGHVVPVEEIVPRSAISMSCRASQSTVSAGDTLEILGSASTVPGKMDLNYAWTSTGGTIGGTGRRVTVNTAGLAPGQYQVTGRATKVDDPSVNAACYATFNVAYGPPQLACVASKTQVIAGEPVTISVQPDPRTAPNTTYSFSTTAGTLQTSDRTAVLQTAGLAPGLVTVNCRATSADGQVKEVAVNVNVVAAEVKAKAKPVELCSVFFKRYPLSPARVDNEAKACLDDVALNLNRAPEAHLLLVGAFSDNKENTQELARLRARSTKNYLVSDKEIDPNRIEMRISNEGIEKSVAIYLVREGDSDSVENAPVITPPKNQ